jgi:hypothetical protein
VLGGELHLRLNDLSREWPAIRLAQHPRSASEACRLWAK